jgi:hypothetical protein
MRKVTIPAGATPPADWQAKAEELTGQLLAAKTDGERKAIIDKNEGVWREERVRDWLLSFFNNKCWYTEAQEVVSAVHVDHYRPKGRVTDIEKKNERDGYWWLAFQWTNYRICGQLINTKKSDVFPLNSAACATCDDPSSIRLEAPALIDPTTDDARLVSYEMDEDGCIAAPVPGADATDSDCT